MERLAREAYMVGTEWDQYDTVFALDWQFDTLEAAFEEGGVLHGQKVWVFGATEPQLVEWKGMHRVVQIPAVVAVTAPFPPTTKLGIKSVQMEQENIVNLKEMKMDWVPFIPDQDEYRTLERLHSQVYVLKCVQRRAALKQLKTERIKKYEYCLPYISMPWKEEADEDDTTVNLMYSYGDEKTTPPVLCEFDWTMDEPDEFVDDLIKEEALPEDQRQAFRTHLVAEVNEAKRKVREAKAERQRVIAEMPAETRAAMENMRFFKFYPTPSDDTPDIEQYKSPFINRYFGKAHQVL
eukprot:TRINITY_DN16139_c0_g1_i1.p1 TRINITY_DN16139_c0_g1~~TRINITY_DN16139_c0_g1_i1.p1  ORF type:complete len:294 (-),score=93.52 TRINITY_DN16139_c0_g1_i1:403-1284(-)